MANIVVDSTKKSENFVKNPSGNLESMADEWVLAFRDYCRVYMMRTGINICSIPELYFAKLDEFYGQWRLSHSVKEQGR